MDKQNPQAINSLDTTAAEQALTSCAEEFSILHMSTINKNKDERDKVYASIELILTFSKTIAMLKVEVDAEAQGNSMPVRVFKQLHPSFIMTPRSNIFGVITVPGRYKGKFIETVFFIVDNQGSVIIGLPTSNYL